MKTNERNIKIIVPVLTILILIIGIMLINNTGILKRIGKNKEQKLEEEATTRLEQALEIAKTKKETDANYNSAEYLENILKEQSIGIYGNITIVNDYNFEIDRENLNVTRAIGKTNVSIETKVVKLLDKSANGKQRAEIEITLTSNTPLDNIIFENEDGTFDKQKAQELTYTKKMQVELDKDYAITIVGKDGKLSKKIFRNTKDDYQGPTIEGTNTEDGTIRLGNELKFTWEQLSEISTAISNNSNITNNIKEIDLTYEENKYTIGVGDWKYADEVNKNTKVRIIGFNHDILAGQIIDENGNINVEYLDSSNNNRLKEDSYNLLKKAGISFEFVDALGANSAMNSSTTNSGGWANSNMKKTILPQRFTSLPENMRKFIKKVTKDYQIQYNNSNVSYTDEYLWLISCKEIYNITKYGNEGNQYKYYKNNNVNLSTTNNCLKKSIPKDEGWWTRSLNIPYSNGFCAVPSSTKNISLSTANAVYGLTPGFCI